VVHWLEALREKVILIAPLEARVVILEGTTLGSAFTRGITSPHGDTGTDVNKLSRTRGTDGGGANVGDWAAVRTVGPTGSGADIIWTALDSISGVGVLTLALSARLMHYNCFDPSLLVGDGSLPDFTGLRPLLRLPNSAPAIETFASFFIVKTDSNRRFKVKGSITGGGPNNYSEYDLMLQGYFR
jgi:hypothetical protein